MPLPLTKEHIARQLKKSYRPGVIASLDGYAGMYEHVTLRCAAQPRLDEFVRRGGTLIVQYQTGNFPTPFPLSMQRMAERVDTLLDESPVDLVVSWFFTRRLLERWLNMPRHGGIGVQGRLGDPGGQRVDSQARVRGHGHRKRRLGGGCWLQRHLGQARRHGDAVQYGNAYGHQYQRGHEKIVAYAKAGQARDAR